MRILTLRPVFFVNVLLIGIILACNSGKEIVPVDPAYGKYVSAYTSGMIDRKSSIRIELTEDQLKDIRKSGQSHIIEDTNELKKLFHFEPEIPGKAVWINSRVVEFVPSKALETGQFYNAEFDLSKVSKTEAKYENFRFQFATYQQQMFVNVYGLRNYSDYELDKQYVYGQLTLSDYADPEKVKTTIQAKQKGKTLPVRIDENRYNKRRYYIYVDSVERGDNPGEVILSWNGEAIKSISRGERVVRVSAGGEFSISGMRVREREEQFVEINFSEPLQANQNLEGLIEIEGIKKLNFTIDYNTVRIYLPNRVVGEKEILVAAGIKNVRGHRISKEHRKKITFHEPKPRVKIIGEGSILPNSQGLIFPFEAVSLKAVHVRVIRIMEHNVHHFLQVNDLGGGDKLTRFGKVVAEKKVALDYDQSKNLKQWNKHVINLEELIKPERGAIYRVSIKFEKKDALCDCSVEEQREEVQENVQEPVWSERTWHGYGYGGGYDTWYDYGDDYSACSDYYYRGKAVSRNVLASDLGLIFKLEEDKIAHAFVSDLLTTEPISGAKVAYYSFRKELIASGQTDEQGMFTTQLKQKPFLMLVKKGEQRGYLKLLDGKTNSLSKFDVQGEQVQKGIKGFLYAERGVWRPGDSIYLNFMLENSKGELPLDYPVKFELRDPSGKIIKNETRRSHLNGLYDFKCTTGTDARTGNYRASVKIGNKVFSKTLKVETVRPNRLKIYLDAKEHEQGKEMFLSAKWLHGATAKNLKAKVDVSLNATRTTFKGYRNYIFDSPIRKYSTHREVVYSGQLDDQGKTSFISQLSKKKEAPGMLSATYYTKVFEKGGGFSQDRMTFVHSPFDRYVGISKPDYPNNTDALETGKTHVFRIATVDKKGKAINMEKLNVKVYKLQWRWWYERGGEDLANYISRTGTVAIRDTVISTKSGKASYRLRINYPEWGRYLVTVTDSEGKHQTGTIVNIDWPYWSRANRKNGENASMLNFSSDKKSYIKGEKVKLTIPSPEAGRALISVESSDKVIEKHWIETKKGETTFEFTSTEEMTPNVFVHVTLVQQHLHTANDLPIRMYGVIPILVDDPETHLHPVLAMADEIRPESEASIRIKEQYGNKMTYTLALVDEGLLDLTSFKTPDPWNSFYAREALGVKTWDMYDDVIGAYAGKLDKMLSIGGDMSGKQAKDAKANRFKPMVVHLGPFELKAGKEAVHKVKIPNYIGSVRVMVVARDEEKYGKTEKAVAVRKPLMILTSLPRVLGPGEEVAVPVNVFAMKDHVKDVQISVEVNGMLQMLESGQKSVHFDKIGDEVVNFRVKVKEQLGLAKIKVIARSGNEVSVQETELDVRAPNPVMTEGTKHVLASNKSWEPSISLKGIKGTNKVMVEFSRVPAMGLEQRIDELVRYPHGCIEQTTSAAFPQLLVDGLMDLDMKRKKQIDEHIKQALKRIQSFQTENGGFAYWPGMNGDNEWGTNYAGHFMIEAERKGYVLAKEMKEHWLKYQKRQAQNWSAYTGSYARRRESGELTQAYRLYVLALAKSPETGAMNRLRESPDLSVAAKWRLAAAYELIGQKQAAKKLTTGLSKKVAEYRDLSGTYGSHVRDQAMILEANSLMGRHKEADAIAEELAGILSSNRWLSTQETAYSLIAMTRYVGEGDGQGGVDLSYQLNGGSVQNKKTGKKVLQMHFGEKELSKKTAFKFKNRSGGKLYAKVVVQGIPLTGDKTSRSNQMELNIVYKDMNGQKLDVKNLSQGTDFVAEVTVMNPGKNGYYREMALTQIFPSGWEIHNERLNGGRRTPGVDYQDIRDDRVYSYYNLAPKKSLTVKVQLNASYMGRFYLPTVYTEAMYNNLINASVHGDWVEVTPEKEL